MLKVIAEDFIKIDCVETVMPLYRELVEKTRQKPLCLSYELFIDHQDPGILFLSRSGPIWLHWTYIAKPNISRGGNLEQSVSGQTLQLAVYSVARNPNQQKKPRRAGLMASQTLSCSD